ncbi:hypothetical protein AAB986_37790, partial [Burkholderia contaminans]|uniref:hypothetical protein n=1 Tax=Burkholderia contaminans TaxID=488447 RepID=UPI00311463E3
GRSPAASSRVAAHALAHFPFPLLPPFAVGDPGRRSVRFTTAMSASTRVRGRARIVLCFYYRHRPVATGAARNRRIS